MDFQDFQDFQDFLGFFKILGFSQFFFRFLGFEAICVRDFLPAIYPSIVDLNACYDTFPGLFHATSSPASQGCVER